MEGAHLQRHWDNRECDQRVTVDPKLIGLLVRAPSVIRCQKEPGCDRTSCIGHPESPPTYNSRDQDHYKRDEQGERAREPMLPINAESSGDRLTEVEKWVSGMKGFRHADQLRRCRGSER